MVTSKTSPGGGDTGLFPTTRAALVSRSQTVYTSPAASPMLSRSMVWLVHGLPQLRTVLFHGAPSWMVLTK